jgi:DNA (cytosine-5)-methyltransferase 1
MKILNLYCGIGGNRKLWGDSHEITAIEIDPTLAKIYSSFFPTDKVIVADAHQYLLDHYKEFDFIWSSPPCPTHSRLNTSNSGKEDFKIPYPDMKLYEEIIFLINWCKTKWVIENVISYYDPLIKPYIFREHYYWANFIISGKERGFRGHNEGIEYLSELKGFDLSSFSGVNKEKLLRNCVEPEAGLSILNQAFKERQIRLT